MIRRLAWALGMAVAAAVGPGGWGVSDHRDAGLPEEARPPSATTPAPSTAAPWTVAPWTATVPPGAAGSPPIGGAEPAGAWTLQQQVVVPRVLGVTAVAMTMDSQGRFTLPAPAAVGGALDADLTGVVTGPGRTWAQGASGSSAAAWTHAIQALGAVRHGRGATYVRVDAPLDPVTGAPGVDPATFRQAWRLFRDVLRLELPGAEAMLTVDAGRDAPATLAQLWPDGLAVDAVAVRARARTPQQAAVIESLADPRGLAAWLDTATARRLPVVVPAYGGDAGLGVQDADTLARWVEAAVAANAPTAGSPSAGRILYALPAALPGAP